MKRRDIILVSLAVAGIILVVLYTQGFFKKQENTFINPVLTESNNKIWTYLEKDYSGTDRISLPHNNKERDIPVFYKYCANLMSKYNTIIVSKMYALQIMLIGCYIWDISLKLFYTRGSFGNRLLIWMVALTGI